MYSMVTVFILWFLVPLPLHGQLSTPSLSRALEEVRTFRRVVLRDTTSLNLCGLKDAYGGDGTIKADIGKAQFKSVAECEVRPYPNSGRNVLVGRVTIQADTMILSGRTYDGGLDFQEEYRVWVTRGPTVHLHYSVPRGWVWR